MRWFMFLLIAITISMGVSANNGWTPETMVKVRRVGDVRVSPDGKRVAYTVTNAVITADRSEYVTQIHMANTDGGERFQVTYSEKSSANPQWSPDGRWLAFISARTGKNNLYLLRMSGGEAEQLTEVKTGVLSFSWSPDGKTIAFVMQDAPSEEEERNSKAKDDPRWVDENIRLNRLYLLKLEKNSEGKRDQRRLTAGNYSVAANQDRSFDWSPDGRVIAFTRFRTPKADDWSTADIATIDLATGEEKIVANSAAAETQPKYSPDGKWLAFTVSDLPPRWAGENTIHIIPASGGQARALANSYDHKPLILGWSSDGKKILFHEARGTLTRIYALEIDKNIITEINRGNEVCSDIDLSADGRTLGLAMQSSDRPLEAFVSSVERFAPVQVSNANADLLSLPVGKTELLTWPSTEGLQIEGLLTYPVNYQAGQRVPLLLLIHGGPANLFSQSYLGGFSIYPIAVWSARGYAILRINPRGSSGYGKSFRQANRRDWGGGDYRDLMAGIDHVIKMGVADPERLGVMGWSYGGFMTSWIITQTPRFKAASVGAGVTNLVSFTGTADIPSFIPDYFEAQPWEDIDVYRSHSPVLNIKGVKTPTLIQHGDADDRVPVSQGFELYNALKTQGVTTRMMVLPRQTHSPNEPKLRIKAMQANIDWFEKYLKN